MKLDIYQIDAFTDRLFGGNPAAVVPLQDWLPDDTMQDIAAENNLAETVFFVATKEGYHIRWFTPELEIDLCGHATLASAFVLYTYLGYDKDELVFSSKSGELKVKKDGDKLQMNFPNRMPVPIASYPDELLAGLGVTDVVGIYKSRDYVVQLKDEAAVLAVNPDINTLNKIDVIGIIVTAPGSDCDFVSRFFAPNCGIPEDPVTGSAHSSLVPFWAKQLNKTTLHAKQVSKRGGELWCEDLGERVTMSGRCVFYMKGQIEI